MGSPRQGITRVTYSCSTLHIKKTQLKRCSCQGLRCFLHFWLDLSSLMEGPSQGMEPPAQDMGHLQAAQAMLSLKILMSPMTIPAMLLAQLLAPLLLQLLTLVVGILPMALSIKAPIINALLAPFQLQLCNTDGTAFPRSFDSESVRSFLPEGISDDKIAIITQFAQEAIQSLTSAYES